MARRDNAYSRLIAAIKVVLPILALGILSLLFFLAQPTREGTPLQFVDTGLEELVEEERLTRPDYRSVTDTGGELRLTGETLRPVPEREGQYTGTTLTGVISNPDGTAFDLTSDAGRLDQLRGLAWLTGSVRLVRHDGHTALSDEVEITTDLSRLVSDGPVHAFGPLGTLDADSMEMLGQPDLGSGTVTIFRGNVRLLYDPQSEEPGKE